MSDSLVLLGVGNVAMHLVELQRSCGTIFGTTRSTDRMASFRAAGIEPIVVDRDPLSRAVLDKADILVSFPPDGVTDALWAQRCAGAKRIIYISSTGVYGKTSGIINEDSPIDPTEATAAKRIQAEEIWRQQGAIILRCPGLYAAETGMHLRLNQLKIPGDGTNYVSRIHLDDLARIIEACFAKSKLKFSTYVVGDLVPSTHLDTITWLCEQVNAPLPGFAPLSEVSPTLRGNRRIDASRLLGELEIDLQFPSYREGYGAILQKVQALR